MAGDVTLVVNPTAGRGRAARLVGPVVERLAAGGLTVRQVCGRDAEEALDLCRAAVADGTDALVVLGGDGMAHLGLQAVAGGPIPLGLVPAGTGNDLARTLRIPRDPVDAAAVVTAGVTRAIDAGRAVTDEGAARWWAGVLGSGFDSAVTERANRMRWPRGPRRYDVAILLELLRMRHYPYVLDLDGHREQFSAAMVAVGNGPSYGGGMRICPYADPTDGLLDVTVVGPISRGQLVRVKPRVYAGTHLLHPLVTSRRAKVVRLAAPGVCAYGDGERIADLPLTCTCVPGALRVLVPAAQQPADPVAWRPAAC